MESDRESPQTSAPAVEPMRPSGDETAQERAPQERVLQPSSRGIPIGIWTLFVASTATVSVLVGTAFGDIFDLPDVEFYLKIAQGDTAHVLQPFALRQLGPLVCRAIAALLHVSVNAAFVTEGVVSLLVLLGIVGFLLLRAGAGTAMLLAVGGLAFWAALFNGLALPDLWFAALLGILLLLLYYQRFLVAAFMLFPLFLSRESTILVLVCLLVAGWRRMRKVDYAVAVIASLAAMRLVKILTSGGMSNREQMSPLLYMAGKVPWNFAKNILGLPPWNPLNTASCAVPQWQTSLHLGGVSAFGVCAWEPALPAWTLRLALSSFGLLPLLLIYLWLKTPRARWTTNVMLRFCILYGALSFVLAPELGSSVPRLFDYAWPGFIVAAPMLAIRHLRLPGRIAWPLVALHLAVAWSAALNTFDTMSFTFEALTILALACAYIAGWMMLRQASFADSKA
jgi:hypothetical protein